MKTTLKKIALIAGAGLFLILASAGVAEQEISARAIVIGVGVDFDIKTDEYIVTSEVISPSGGSGDQQGAFSKYVVTRGETVSQALFAVYRETGSQASLGQCQLVILGESLYKDANIKHAVSYFNLLEAVIDSAALCCAKGSAYALMQTHLVQAQGISFSLTQILKEAADSIALPVTTLVQFSKTQLDGGKCGGITVAEFKTQQLPANEEGSGTKALQGGYYCGEIAVFKNYNFVTTLDGQQSLGFTLAVDGAVGQHFAIKRTKPLEYESQTSAVVVTDKSASAACKKTTNGYEVSIDLKAGVQNAGRNYWGKQGQDYPLIKRTLTEEELSEVKVQIQDAVNAFVEVQKQYDFDLLGISKSFEVSLGSAWRQNPAAIAEINFTVSVKTYET